MLISRKILQSYFDQELPPTNEIAEGLTMHSYEVEGVEAVGTDEIIDVDVLPNRASDSLSHIGVAREVGMIFDMVPNFSNEKVVLQEKDSEMIELTIEDNSAHRFVAVLISGLEGGETPSWMREVLESLGERSISPVVDITNYVMLATGQPLHAYDLDIIESISNEATLSVSFAQKDEKLTLLDGAELSLAGEELLIRTKSHPLGLAGVKGGLESGVSDKTTRILLEAATFDSRLVRRTAKLTKAQTGASKRFENGVPAEIAAVGVDLALKLLAEVYPEMRIDSLRDLYPKPEEPTKITLKKEHPEKLLGIKINDTEIKNALKKIGAEVVDEESYFLVSPPWYRPDIKLPVDLIDEVGRLYGLAKIKAVEMSPKAVTPERSTVAKEIVRDILVGDQFSEIITRAFRRKGEVELANPLATDTPFLRGDLLEGIQGSLELAAQNAELLEIDYARVFEIGTVFSEKEEALHLAIGVQKTKNAQNKLNLKDELSLIEDKLSERLSVDFSKYKTVERVGDTNNIVEYNLDKIIGEVDLMPQFKYEEPVFRHFQEFSAFPYVLRDIAIWTPAETTAEDIEDIIRKAAGNLLRVVSFFDRFEKDFDGIKRVSFAFRLVFQSFEKTLSDEEVNREMELISSALSTNQGFEIR